MASPGVIKVEARMTETEEFKAMLGSVRNALIALQYYVEGDAAAIAVEAIAQIKEDLNAVGIEFSFSDSDS